MKILVVFDNKDCLPQILGLFINMEKCVADDNQLLIPGLIKIDYSQDNIKCYCLSLTIVDMILSQICHVDVESSNNEGNIYFPNSFVGIMLESEISDFSNILDISSKGNINYINTDLKKIKSNMKLSPWLSCDLIVDNDIGYVNIRCNNYKITVSDGSALKYCERVKSHPLMPMSILNTCFKFDNDIKIKPNKEYVCLWKVLKSDGGYKKYSNFINDFKDKIQIEYEEGKKYKCQFENGKVEFQLLSIGDKYPKKIIIQMNVVNDLEIINVLKNYFNLKSLDIIAKVSNLKLDTLDLLHKLNFKKDDNFFTFTSFQSKINAQYDIATGVLSIKQECDFLFNDINQYNDSIKEMERIVDEIISYAI